MIKRFDYAVFFTKGSGVNGLLQVGDVMGGGDHILSVDTPHINRAILLCLHALDN